MAIPKSLLATPFTILPTSVYPCLSISCSSDGADVDDNGTRPPQSSTLPHLSFSKPSWVVHTQSNVRTWVRKKPSPSCVVCDGSGRVDCTHCLGKGRTNCTHLMMLPRGNWPKWCKTCGGSGLYYCDRCLGPGEYRDAVGFHFLRKTDASQTSGHITSTQENGQFGAADFLLSEPANPGDESD